MQCTNVHKSKVKEKLIEKDLLKINEKKIGIPLDYFLYGI